ncbi:hypothetical protein ACFWVB_20105 [Streptomyces microflavus]|uniref:hypothetical protein n=1 Tax=Streptomyces microflavus TaxID=1919 RepID=UPI00365053A2
MLTDLILVSPARELRRAFAGWAVDQDPKVRTASSFEFAVPAPLFVTIPEALLIGSTVDGHPYVSPTEGTPPARLLNCGTCFEEDGEEVHPHPECTERLALVGVATDEGFRTPVDGMLEAVPGDVMPEVPADSYDPAPLDAPDDASEESAPLDDKTCPVCAREFSSARGRDTHQRQAHADTEES